MPTNTTTDFIAALDLWDNVTDPKRKMTDQELALVVSYAEGAKDAEGYQWPRFQKLLINRCDFDKADAVATVRASKVKAALGLYPYTETQFIPAYLAAYGYRMTFNEDFVLPNGVTHGMARMLDELKMWTNAYGIFKNTYDSALRSFIEDERFQIARRAFGELRYDANLDPGHTELRKWLSLVLRPTGDEEADAQMMEASVLAMVNWIHRVKNHIGAYGNIKGVGGAARWFHYSHMMPVFYGAQEDGKTMAVRHLLSSLGDLFTGAGFELLEDNSKQYRLTYMPVMMFDELAGLKNANVEKLKGMMTEERRDIRQIYQAASSRTLVTSFIGCTNEDINGLIKDKSGNRRYFQMITQPIDVGAMKAIDTLKIWKSVDEDETVAPMIADRLKLEALRKSQSDQRFKSSTEEWTEECSTIPANEWVGATRLFTDSFYPWLERSYPSETKFANVNKFSRELKRLTLQKGSLVELRTSRKEGNSYRIAPNNVISIATERKIRLQDMIKNKSDDR
ncbi:VapE domain-containing protein [Microvirga pudoricolor]|uniref:VapE domain-containing protein n=1 Tax=Microvirga pudoricolor TaxID=2778729 RepID=UPI00194F6DBE|nr:VapE domain-containing protein [Microvirga pudoricolor]MBM6595564.1 hypothetical protein [Microvirga pudoricolor]